MKRPAVFFDRDNTLIANDGYLADPSRVALIDGAADAVARVRSLGFAAVTISNQSGVARGMFTEEAVHAVNARMDELLLDHNPSAVIDRHEFCPYHPQAVDERYRQESELRKPRPGMILQAAEKLALDLSRSWVIGDAPRDIEAGKSAGCRAILFRDPNLPASEAADTPTSIEPDFVAASLKEAVELIEKAIAPAPAPAPDSQPAPEPVVAPAPAVEPRAEPVAAAPAEPPPAPNAEPAPRRPMTFAERVKAGTFQPARAPGSLPASAAEKPARAIPMAARASSSASSPASPAAAHHSAPEPTARPTEPVSEGEQMAPLLQQILEELRRGREPDYQEFSVSKLLAGIVQVLVLPVLFYAYLHHDQPQQVQSLLLMATFLQTLTIALLIMGKQR